MSRRRQRSWLFLIRLIDAFNPSLPVVGVDGVQIFRFELLLKVFWRRFLLIRIAIATHAFRPLCHSGVGVVNVWDSFSRLPVRWRARAFLAGIGDLFGRPPRPRIIGRRWVSAVLSQARSSLCAAVGRVRQWRR